MFIINSCNSKSEALTLIVDKKGQENESLGD